MATNLEKRRQGEQFRMIDPPGLPTRPYWPNRLVFSVGGLALGVALGVGIAVLMNFFRPKIYQADELVELLGAGYVLALPAFTTAQESVQARRRRIWETAAAVVLAVAIPAITIAGVLK